MCAHEKEKKKLSECKWAYRPSCDKKEERRFDFNLNCFWRNYVKYVFFLLSTGSSTASVFIFFHFLLYASTLSVCGVCCMAWHGMAWVTSHPKVNGHKMRHLAVIGLCIILSSELFRPFFHLFLAASIIFVNHPHFCAQVLFSTLSRKLHSLSFVCFAIVFPCFCLCFCSHFTVVARLSWTLRYLNFKKPFDLLPSFHVRHLLIIFRLMRFNFIMHIYFQTDQPTHPCYLTFVATPPQPHRSYPFYV